MTKLIVRRAARADVRATREWYEAEAAGLGERFLRELDEIVARVRQMPLQFPAVRASLRRALLRRFPYSVYFLEREDAVVIVAVLHQHRNPIEWHRRSRLQDAE